MYLAFQCSWTESLRTAKCGHLLSQNMTYMSSSLISCTIFLFFWNLLSPPLTCTVLLAFSSDEFAPELPICVHLPHSIAFPACLQKPRNPSEAHGQLFRATTRVFSPNCCLSQLFAYCDHKIGPLELEENFISALLISEVSVHPTLFLENWGDTQRNSRICSLERQLRVLSQAVEGERFPSSWTICIP